MPFVSDTESAKQLQAAGVPDEVTTQFPAENSCARIDALRAELRVAALYSVLAPFFTGLVPDVAVGRRWDEGAPDP